MSSASESACSRDGEGDTELDLDVNILPQWGCFWPGPPTPRAGKDARLRARAGERRAAAGAVGARPSQCRRGAAGSGAAALKRAGPERGAEGVRGPQPAAGARDWSGPGGNLAGRAAQPSASSICPPRYRPNSTVPDWLGGAGERAGGPPRAPISAGAGRRAGLSASGRSPRVARPGMQPQHLPSPTSRAHVFPVPSCLQRLHRNWAHVCFVMGLESSLLASGWRRARVWGQTTGLAIPTWSLHSSTKLQ